MSLYSFIIIMKFYKTKYLEFLVPTKYKNINVKNIKAINLILLSENHKNYQKSRLRDIVRI